MNRRHLSTSILRIYRIRLSKIIYWSCHIIYNSSVNFSCNSID
uniref:Uncharacterized protein n=1 Tax=Podoviridae sp. ct8Lf7 TaxID=2827723 RepID=A0A8S5S1X0_9CAUD|nr:MAG TPA: hypothetical protein [Podoviridae sp. ct8Lf7]